MESAKVLVVDDEEYIRQLLALGLSKFGHTVLTAEDGMTALEWLASNEVDIVITDIQRKKIRFRGGGCMCRIKGPGYVAF